MSDMAPRELHPHADYNFLQAIIEKCEGAPKVLILSWGNRPGGAEPPRRVQEWAARNGYDCEMHITNPHDKSCMLCTSGTQREAIASFIEKHSAELSKVVIFHQGHGQSGTGAWQNAVTPQEVAKMVDGRGNITVVTGACFGGNWLKYFEGVTATNEELPGPGDGHGGEFWPWLFHAGPFPSQRLPMQRGLGSSRYPDAHSKRDVDQDADTSL